MTRSHVDDHVFGEAFLANRMQRLVDLIVEQGNDMLESAGVFIPSRCVSALLLINERESVSVADMAAALCLPHQLVTQRVDLLEKLGVVRREVDPADTRRKNVTLTKAGQDQYCILDQQLKISAAAIERLQQEVGVELSPIILELIQALRRVPLKERMQEINNRA